MKRPQIATPLSVGYFPIGWGLPFSRRSAALKTEQHVREGRLKAAIRRLQYKRDEAKGNG